MAFIVLLSIFFITEIKYINCILYTHLEMATIKTFYDSRFPENNQNLWEEKKMSTY